LVKAINEAEASDKILNAADSAARAYLGLTKET